MTKQEKLANYEMMKNECFETRKLNDSLGKLIVVKNKKIKELEQKLEQTEKDLADYQFNYPTIKELQKENAELKKLKRECETSLCRAEYQYNYEQLTKAKEIIRDLLGSENTSCEEEMFFEIRQKAEQFLSEVEDKGNV